MIQENDTIPADDRSLQERLSYRFRDEGLLLRALTHKSYANEHTQDSAGDNERLELLGDAVLDMVLTEMIVDRFETLSEGQLSKLRASVVSEPALAEIARELELGPCLRVGRGEQLSGGQDKNSILSDALEALLAAVYLDSKASEGIEAIERVVRALFESRVSAGQNSSHQGDYKTELQELAQKELNLRAIYRVLSEEGPDHDKRYEVGVYLGEQEYGRGEGGSKKQSEQRAAQAALEEYFWKEERA